ncbi:hypothetical protein ES706_02037 [subsurface metagenome]
MNADYTITIKPSEIYFGVYRSLFRQQVHQLIAWGHRSARHSIQSNNEEEPNITGYITEAIRARLVTNSPPWCVYYFVHEDTPIAASGRSGRSRPRPDIIIETNLGGRPEYVFEAKRLRINGFEASKYIDSDGMGCFVSGLYASRYDEAAMLGYIQSDSLIHWKDQVKKTIDENAEQLCLESPQYDKTVIDVFPLEWVSEHKRVKAGHSIAIYHILLDCCA